MTTYLSVLSSRLQQAIGDENAAFASRYTQAINDAARETYPTLSKKVIDYSLVSGNVLPNSHFESWAATTIPDLYTTSTGGCLQETTTIRGSRGTSSCKVTASGANDYMSLTSASWPSLLGLMGKTIPFECWAYPQTANDATIIIYTVQADGTEQTLTSTTTCPASKWTLLTLGASLNDDLVDIQFRFNVATDGQYVIFDNSHAIGDTLQYLLPTSVRDVSYAGLQLDSDDFNLSGRFRDIVNPQVINDGTYKYLLTPRLSPGKIIKLEGTGYLEDDLDESTDTMSIDDPETNVLVTYAAYLLYERVSSIPSSDSSGRYEREAAKWLNKFYILRDNLTSPFRTRKLKLPTPY